MPKKYLGKTILMKKKKTLSKKPFQILSKIFFTTIF